MAFPKSVSTQLEFSKGNLAILDPDFGLKGEAVQYSFMLIIAHC